MSTLSRGSSIFSYSLNVWMCSLIGAAAIVPILTDGGVPTDYFAFVVLHLIIAMSLSLPLLLLFGLSVYAVYGTTHRSTIKKGLLSLQLLALYIQALLIAASSEQFGGDVVQMIIHTHFVMALLFLWVFRIPVT